MEFKHKLSRRLAISRGMAALLLCSLALAACDESGAGDGLTQPGTPAEFSWGRGKKGGDTTAIFVPKPHLVSVSIAPDTALLAPGAHQGFTARGQLRDGTSVNLLVNWSV